MCVSKSKTKLAIAMLALIAAVPAYAGQACDLIDGNVAVEDPASSNASGVDALACGQGNEASGQNAAAVGGLNFATGEEATAIGFLNQASGLSSTALGNRNFAAGDFSTAIGSDSQANAAQSVAIGHFSRVEAENSVALGSGAIADRANTVSVGAAGAERQIVNVAAGTQATDAANVAQMNAGDASTLTAANAYTDSKFAGLDFAGINDRFGTIEQRLNRQDARIDRIGAMGGALAGMAMNSANLSGRNRVAVGVGSQGGRQAIAVGYQRALLGTRASVSLGAAFSGRDNTVSGGAGYSW